LTSSSERLATSSNTLESAVKLSSSFQAQHAAAQSTIPALESKGRNGSHVKAVETNFGTTAAKFDAGLACLAVLQQFQLQQRASQPLSMGNENGEVVKGFRGVGGEG
jgi:hypothetical protein